MWTKPKESTRPGIRRITSLAVLVLEQAATDAARKPIERTPAHRLALAWLTYMGFASTMQADSFWKLLGHVGGYTDPDSDFRRAVDARVMLEGWRRRAINR